MLVLQYLQHGEPVSSRQLAAFASINASSATVRNIMSELEGLGLLTSPHTSAGRIPSAKGLRFFVDKLLVKSQPTRKDIEGLRRGISGTTTHEVFNSTARLISQITQYAGFIVTPPASIPTVKQLQFIKLSSHRVLAVMELSSGDVANRIISNEGEAVAAKTLKMAADLYNRHFSDQPITTAKKLLAKELSDLSTQIRQILKSLLDGLSDDLHAAGAADADMQIFGKSNLVNTATGDLARLQELYDLLKHKTALLRLLQDCLTSEEVHLFIGSECGLDALDDCSMVFSACGSREQPLGMIGVIGPKRMRYNKIIPTVDMTAKMLNNILCSRQHAAG